MTFHYHAEDQRYILTQSRPRDNIRDSVTHCVTLCQESEGVIR